jgi:hypothetical protein
MFLHGNHSTCGRDFIDGFDNAAFKGARIDDRSDHTLLGRCPEVARYGGGQRTKSVCRYMACNPPLTEVLLAALPKLRGCSALP